MPAEQKNLMMSMRTAKTSEQQKAPTEAGAFYVQT
jgi:hypothetical protein